VAVNVDITQRKQAEEALRLSEKRLRRFYESGLLGVIYWNMDGQITDANDKFLEMAGYDREDLTSGRINWIAMTPPKYQHLVVRSTEELKATGVNAVPFEKEYIRKDGTRVPVIVAGAMLDQTRFNGVGFVLDITDRKQAEDALCDSEERYHLLAEELERRVQQRTAELKTANEQFQREIEEHKQAEAALRQSERRFRDYFEHGLIGMARNSLDKRWLEVNDRLCEIVGYSREELIQRTWTELTYPDDLKPNLQLFDRLLAGEIEHFSLDKRFIRKDRSIVYTTIYVRVFRNEDGSSDHIVTLFEDITARKLAEAVLEREHRTLRHMLQASDHERQLIAYDIHDGLAQQLAGAIMQFQVYTHQKDAKHEDAQQAFDGGLALLRQGHAETRRLISGVRPPILDESGVMAAIAHLIHDPAFDDGPKVEFHSRVTFTRLAPVVENIIYRIIQEGLTNARTHSKSKTVRINFIQRGDRLRIEIRDRGIGFDPKAVPEDRFGLEGIQERARLLEGKCSIKSKPGEGTSVIVELPVVERE
jgi:PAS domain S-box-containing protein